MIHRLREVEDVVGGGAAAMEHDDCSGGGFQRRAQAMDRLVLVGIDACERSLAMLCVYDRCGRFVEFERGETLLDHARLDSNQAGNSEFFAESLDRFVEGESGRVGGQLEEDSAGLAEVDGMEVSAIHDRSYIDILADFVAPG